MKIETTEDAFEAVKRGELKVSFLQVYFAGKVIIRSQETGKRELRSAVKNGVLLRMEDNAAFKNGKPCLGYTLEIINEFISYFKAQDWCEQSLVVDPNLFDQLNKTKHGSNKKKSGPANSGKNGNKFEDSIKDIFIGDSKIRTLPGPLLFGRDVKGIPYKWDVILYCESARMLIVIEAKTQHGGGSADDGWCYAMTKIKEVHANHIAGKSWDTPTPKTRVFNEDIDA